MGQVARLAATAVVVLLMLDGGFRPPVGRLFSWPMYSWTVMVIVEVETVDRGPDGWVCRPAELYDALPPGEFAVPPDLLDVYLDHLRQDHDGVICRGHMYGPFGEAPINVVDVDVAAR